MAASKYSVVDSSWELVDPNPDIFELFAQFNQEFFWGKLGSVYVKWSPRMTLCAGLCRYSGRNQECSISLSKPLLSLRPRKDLVETLLHEMIHAYLFVAENNRERESHGPHFHEHMYRINRLTGANITVYHTFNDEVDYFKTHWWKCNGPCQHRPPYYGMVKRSMNRAPGPSDFWYKTHQSNCGGSFVKIKEPSPKKSVKRKKEEKSEPERNGKAKKITSYFTPTSPPKIPSTENTPSALSSPLSTSSQISSIDPFAGRGFVLGAIGNSTVTASSSKSFSFSGESTNNNLKLGGSQSKPQPPGRAEHPLFAKWTQNYKDPTRKPRPTATVTKIEEQPSVKQNQIAPGFNIEDYMYFDSDDEIITLD
ncbi:SprT-like domain-containing protein Spartan [Orchesella cincta]|uniref:SprT-like domain-containing protein Spartan n=1 Tax=Orchesella cincta TaxID=48709 RepID=A0A1D2N448_ORCCI|nr:SprT-like domain-containing protein Spartan [Orchesella cincta]